MQKLFLTFYVCLMSISLSVQAAEPVTDRHDESKMATHLKSVEGAEDVPQEDGTWSIHSDRFWRILFSWDMEDRHRPCP